MVADHPNIKPSPPLPRVDKKEPLTFHEKLQNQPALVDELLLMLDKCLPDKEPGLRVNTDDVVQMALLRITVLGWIAWVRLVEEMGQNREEETA